MSVAESMVIFGPMDQLGCASACSGVTAASSAAVRPRKGPPEPVSSSSSSGAAGGVDVRAGLAPAALGPPRRCTGTARCARCRRAG